MLDKIDAKQNSNKEAIRWNLNSDQLKLVIMPFEGLKEWFNSRKIDMDINIQYVGQLFGRLHIDYSSKTYDTFLIIDKYKQFSLDLLNEVHKKGDDYENMF